VIMASRGAKGTTDTFPNRVSALGSLVNPTTVQHDDDKDKIEGGAGSDWYLDYPATGQPKKITDKLIKFSAKDDRLN